MNPKGTPKKLAKRLVSSDFSHHAEVVSIMSAREPGSNKMPPPHINRHRCQKSDFKCVASDIIRCVCACIVSQIMKSEESGYETDGEYSVFDDPSVLSSSVSLEDVQEMFAAIHSESQMEYECMVVVLIYIERIAEASGHRFRICALNWRLVLCTCMMLASKVWDDFSMVNKDFAYIVSNKCGFVKTLSNRKVNLLEVVMLKLFDFNMEISAEEYRNYHSVVQSLILSAAREKLSSEPKSQPGTLRQSSGGGRSVLTMFHVRSGRSYNCDEEIPSEELASELDPAGPETDVKMTSDGYGNDVDPAADRCHTIAVNDHIEDRIAIPQETINPLNTLPDTLLYAQLYTATGMVGERSGGDDGSDRLRASSVPLLLLRGGAAASNTGNADIPPGGLISASARRSTEDITTDPSSSNGSGDGDEISGGGWTTHTPSLHSLVWRRASGALRRVFGGVKQQRQSAKVHSATIIDEGVLTAPCRALERPQETDAASLTAASSAATLELQ